MAKRKKAPAVKTPASQSSKTAEGKFSHAAFLIPAVTTLVGFVAQMVIALVVYSRLPVRIPAVWIGYLPPEQTIPKYLVFLVFPAAEVILFLIAIFSPRDAKGRRVMERSVSATLFVTALLFVALQASIFRLVGR